jgi:hypothetical protein
VASALINAIFTEFFTEFFTGGLMTIAVGDKIPSVELSMMGKDGPEVLSTDELLGGKKSCSVRAARRLYPDLLGGSSARLCGSW